MNQLDKMTADVVLWIRDHIPDADRDPVNTAIKLGEEVSELTHAIYTDDGDIADECADVLILLLDIAYLNGVDLNKAFNKKMIVNRDRKWSKVKGALKNANAY